ncbi:hypothetical protein CHS0354_027544 [Potamilus streckersoni]|uniref:Uncharacterized protein n=1 Tax=Potamilus streckersoni TaxID=2493646 RepID=A0AAE0VNF0_9BIVA|nr:hypothetical protein CHS0354_027544 [Potamilus streckersoni]
MKIGKTQKMSLEKKEKSTKEKYFLGSRSLISIASCPYYRLPIRSVTPSRMQRMRINFLDSFQLRRSVLHLCFELHIFVQCERNPALGTKEQHDSCCNWLDHSHQNESWQGFGPFGCQAHDKYFKVQEIRSILIAGFKTTLPLNPIIKRNDDVLLLANLHM